jgi:hypothetical protein
MGNLETFAKTAGLTNQQAYTFAVCVRYAMKQGLTIEQAVAHQMKALGQMAKIARAA